MVWNVEQLNGVSVFIHAAVEEVVIVIEIGDVDAHIRPRSRLQRCKTLLCALAVPDTINVAFRTVIEIHSDDNVRITFYVCVGNVIFAHSRKQGNSGIRLHNTARILAAEPCKTAAVTCSAADLFGGISAEQILRVRTRTEIVHADRAVKRLDFVIDGGSPNTKGNDLFRLVSQRIGRSDAQFVFARFRCRKGIVRNFDLCIRFAHKVHFHVGREHSTRNILSRDFGQCDRIVDFVTIQQTGPHSDHGFDGTAHFHHRRQRAHIRVAHPDFIGNCVILHLVNHELSGRELDFLPAARHFYADFINVSCGILYDQVFRFKCFAVHCRYLFGNGKTFQLRFPPLTVAGSKRNAGECKHTAQKQSNQQSSRLHFLFLL